MAEAAVSFRLENLKKLVEYYAHLIGGAEAELNLLMEDLDILKGFLVKAGKMANKDDLFKRMEKRVREAVHDAEDTIDSCLTEAALRKESRSNFLKRLHGSKRLVLAEEVKSVRETKVKPNMELVKGLIGDGSAGASEEQPAARQKKDPIIRAIDSIVGFEDEEATLTSCLMEQRGKLDVVSIIGMPGLGKTTLAWKMYESSKIRFEFPVRIWVYVSQEFNIRDVLLNILKVFTGGTQDMSSMTNNELAKSVREYLEEAKFLLVMDDIWDVDVWGEIRKVLPMDNAMSKVLITSRFTNVGIDACVDTEPHMLRFLRQDESWELLRLEVFGKNGECPKDLEWIGRHIAKECDGLPLAIVVIGGILRDLYWRKKSKSEIEDAWKEVSENVSAYFRNNKQQATSDIVALSYKKLPEELRECFVYLGVFPEDYRIPVWRLIRLWIAEGLVQHKEGQSLEGTAEENLKDLIDRNLVMVGEMAPNGELKACRVHDLIRDFCLSMNKELNLFQEIKKPSKQQVFEPEISDLQKYRRLCIHSRLHDFLHEIQFGKVKVPRIRSFLCFTRESFSLKQNYISVIPEAFPLLRILDSKSFKFHKFPDKVTKLLHLRYITLSCDDLKVLPENLAELWNLQTLLVTTMSRTIELRANIWKMIQLRHVKTKAEITLAIKGEAAGIDAGKNLQTLCRLSPKHCTKQVFNKSRNLKRLGIRGCLASDFDFSSLENLNCLENLKLVNDVPNGLPSDNALRGLPQHNCFPKRIKRLTLSAAYLDWKHMSVLAKIETLQILKLKDRAFTGKLWCVDGGFTHLQFLLVDTTDLVHWVASNDHFPALSFLVLKNCENLGEIPLGLAKSLQVLTVERVIPRSAVDSAKKIKEKQREMYGANKARWGELQLKIGPGCDQ